MAKTGLIEELRRWTNLNPDNLLTVRKAADRIEEVEKALRDCHRGAVGYEGMVAVYQDGYADTTHNKRGDCRYCAVLGVSNVETVDKEEF